MKKLILLVEDNEHDIFFLQRAFSKAGITSPIEVVNDGRQALEYLQGAGNFADRLRYPVPDLVLLDLKLPELGGLEVLRWIRSRPEFRTLVVVILTSSHLEMDVHRAYVLGANSFLVKTGSLDELVRMSRLVHDYWLELNQPPPSAFDVADEEAA